MKESSATLYVSVLLMQLASSTIALSAALLPSHGSPDYCPPRYLTGEELALEEAFVDMGDKPYDPYGFPELERKAAVEVQNWDQPNSPSAIVTLLSELDQRGFSRLENPPSVICDYDASTIRSLLWLATKIIWKQQERKPIDAHTFLAVADIGIIRFWEKGFKEGLYGLPQDIKMAECWRKSNVAGRKNCMAKRPDIIADLDQRIAEFGPKL